MVLALELPFHTHVMVIMKIASIHTHYLQVEVEGAVVLLERLEYI
jgi:hypothetical protein